MFTSYKPLKDVCLGMLKIKKIMVKCVVVKFTKNIDVNIVQGIAHDINT
jgi:hypothetical protein